MTATADCRVCDGKGHFFLCNHHWRCANPIKPLNLELREEE